MPRINQLPAASSVASTDVVAIDTPEKTYQVPRSVLAPAPFQSTIPTGQWSGSGSDRYITVTASNVTADAMLYPFYDNASAALLNGPVWVIPADGSFTIHTSAIPSGTVTISVLLAGIVGEAQYQVLADVYSKSQVDSIVSQSTAHAYQEGSGGLQLNSTLMACNMLLLIFRRYGYWDSLIAPVAHIKDGLTTAGAFIRFSTNEIKVTIDTTGLVALTGNGASDLIVHVWGLF